MVQMKGNKKAINVKRLTELYIPHGSDESMLFFVLLLCVMPLYPTWFR